MVTCICHNISDQKVQLIFRQCPNSKVHKTLGVKPMCNKCIPTINEIRQQVKYGN